MLNRKSSAQRSYLSLLASIVLGTAFVTAGPQAALAQCSSLWTINGSTVCLASDGDKRVLRYENPRPGLRDEGVVRGSLLFEGKIDGAALAGTAYVFSGRCDRAFPYPVTGTIDAEARTIILRGQPVARLSRDCQVVARREDEQRIELVHATEPRRAVTAVVAPTADDGAQRRFSAFLAQLQTCQSGDLKACDEASRYEQVTPEDRLRITEMRAAVVTAAAERARVEQEARQRLDQERGEREAILARETQTRARLVLETDARLCLAGDRAACSTVLASPILAAADRARLERRIAELEAPRPILPPVTQRKAEPAAVIQSASLFSLPLAPMLGWLVPALGLVLVVSLVVLGWKRRGRSAPDAARSTGAPKPSIGPHERQASSQPPATPPRSPAAQPAPAPAPTSTVVRHPTPAPMPPSTPPRLRDTPAALEDMQLAFAYLEEVRAAPSPGLEDTAERKELLNTLSLATKRLEAATAHDPDAMFETTDANGTPIRFTINELKAEVLLTEGLTHQIYDVARVLPAFSSATRHDPENARAFYALGVAHAVNMNKASAIEALQRAVALDPSNFEYRKELDRVENLSTAAVVVGKVTRTGEKVYDAGIKTANAGISIYNFFVVIWNIFAFTWNVVTFPLRLMGKIFGLFDRALGRA